MKTTRRGLFGLFAVAAIAPTAVAKEARTAPPLPKPIAPAPALQATGFDGGHTHSITYPPSGYYSSHGYWWNGTDDLSHKHSIFVDGKVWVLA